MVRPLDKSTIHWHLKIKFFKHQKEKEIMHWTWHCISYQVTAVLAILFWGWKCRAVTAIFFFCITLHNLNLWAKSKALLVQNPNETRKPLKKALENWIKLAISQSGPAAMLKQKGLVHSHEHTGWNCAWGCFPLISSSVFSRELLSKGGQISLQAC